MNNRAKTGPGRILIVDDEPDLRDLLALTLEEMGLEPVAVADLPAARARLGDGNVDLVLTDMRLADGDGLDLVDWMQTHAPGVPVAVITAYGNVEVAVRALKAGAFDFIAKPVDVPQLRRLVGTALKLEQSRAAAHDDSPLLGRSAVMGELRNLIARVARSQAPVLIGGESGTGKELVARLIHAASARADRPFAPVNCGAIPSELMESELFGHRRGSFTGAYTDRPGLIKSAEGGTVFLDEVSELPLPMQVKLLRVIQERSVRAVGGTEEVPVDVRFLSATHRDLPRLVAEGKFREDLYYRLDVITLRVPPLRERGDDIPLLAVHFLGRLAARAGRPAPSLSADALERLAAHEWPGNVRELENVLERAFTLTAGPQIGTDDLSLRAPATARAAAPAPGAATGGHPLPEVLDNVEREAIERALRATRGNRTAAARLLGMSLRQLRYRIAKLGIDA